MSKMVSPRASSKVKVTKNAKGREQVVTLCLAIDHVCYNVGPLPAGEFGTRAFRLTKHSAKDDCYDVIRTHDGLVECSCPSYEVTHRGTSSVCKHGRALVAMGLLDAPSWGTSGPARPLVAGVDRVRDEFDEEAPAPCCDPATEVEPCAACVEAPEPVSLEEYLAITRDDPRLQPSIADREGAAAEPDPLADLPFPRPTRKPPEPAASTPKPVRAIVPPDGRYSLDELVDGQAAYFRGMNSAPFDLMAKALADLAAHIRATGARNCADFEDRRSVMDDELASRHRSEGFEAGYQSAMQEAGCLA